MQPLEVLGTLLKAQQPSQTAAMVACMRALAEHGLTQTKGFRDPTAETLLPPRWARFLRWMEPRLNRLPESRRARVLSRLDILPLRTLAIDSALRDALARGCEQLVILGAGLDGRAYRMTELSQVHVFEVDHPATQGYKRSRVPLLTPTCRELTFVSVDFERESLAARLEASRHLRNRRTAWSWEGVTMYLTDAALRATLDDVVACSAQGSVLMVQYGEPRKWAQSGFLLMPFLLWLWNEPQIGARSRETMKAELERVGFQVTSDSGIADWARRFGAPPPAPEAMRTRLSVARKT